MPRGQYQRKKQPTLIQGAPGTLEGPEGIWPSPPLPSPSNFGPMNGSTFTAPPPPGPRNPFINAQFVWQRKGQFRARIESFRAVRIFRQGEAPGWFLDLALEDGTHATARVNMGDSRHQKLYAKFGANIVGQTVTVRLTNPGDNTKAPWTID